MYTLDTQMANNSCPILTFVHIVQVNTVYRGGTTIFERGGVHFIWNLFNRNIIFFLEPLYGFIFSENSEKISSH